ncbi:MAG TPA: hypothetical protein VFI96_05460, partial [Longimicrobiaceae bacterium]|nr:hypothetical protein [Longimicrobiaceae bacterium]
HRLLDLGFTTRRVVLLLYAVATLFGALALVLVFAPPHSVVLITAAGSGLSMCVVVFGVRELNYHEFVALGSVVARAPAKLHTILKDRIHAGDLIPVLRLARTLEQVNSVLAGAADLFSFGHVEVCSSASTGSWQQARARWGADLWKLDYPVSRLDPETGDGFVLRIWCAGGNNHRPYGAERVAGILGPVLREWFDAHQDVEIPAEQTTMAGELARRRLAVRS